MWPFIVFLNSIASYRCGHLLETLTDEPDHPTLPPEVVGCSGRQLQFLKSPKLPFFNHKTLVLAHLFMFSFIHQITYCVSELSGTVLGDRDKKITTRRVVIIATISGNKENFSADGVNSLLRCGLSHLLLTPALCCVMDRRRITIHMVSQRTWTLVPALPLVPLWPWVSNITFSGSVFLSVKRALPIYRVLVRIIKQSQCDSVSKL